MGGTLFKACAKLDWKERKIMIFSISLAVLLLSFGLLSFEVVAPVICVRDKTVHRLWMTFIISCSIFLYYNKPQASTDLWRHYYAMDQLSQGIIPTEYSVLYVFYFLLWIVALTGKYTLLPSLNFLVIGILSKQIIKKYALVNETHPRAMIMYYFMVLAGIGIFSIVSGIRCALVSAIFAWNYYYFFKEKKLVYYIIAGISCFIHIIGFLFLGLVLVYQILNALGYKQRILIIIFFVVGSRILMQTNVVGAIASWVPGSIGTLLYQKVVDYHTMNSGQVNPDGKVEIINIIFMVCLLLSYIKQKNQDMLVYAIFAVTVFGGLIGIVSSRLSMLISLLMLPVINNIYINIKSVNKKTAFSVVLYMGCFYEIFCSVYSMCAHVLFNGYNYRDVIARFLGV